MSFEQAVYYLEQLLKAETTEVENIWAKSREFPSRIIAKIFGIELNDCYIDLINELFYAIHEKKITVSDAINRLERERVLSLF